MSEELSPVRAAVTERREASKAVVKANDVIAERLRRQSPAIQARLPKHMDHKRFERIAYTQIRKNPGLMRCNPDSLIASVLALAQVGLEPDGRNAHLVPFGNECQYIIDYRGYIELADRSGRVEDIYAEVVYSNDTFEVTKGLHRDLVHKPAKGDKGQLTHAYAVCHKKGGGYVFVVLDKEEIEHRMSRSKTAKSSSSAWNTDTAAMWRKTAIRALAPLLPYSPELVNADRAENGESILDVDSDEAFDITDAEELPPDAA